MESLFGGFSLVILSEFKCLSSNILATISRVMLCLLEKKSHTSVNCFLVEGVLRISYLMCIFHAEREVCRGVCWRVYAEREVCRGVLEGERCVLDVYWEGGVCWRVPTKGGEEQRRVLEGIC